MAAFLLFLAAKSRPGELTKLSSLGLLQEVQTIMFYTILVFYYIDGKPLLR